MRRVVVTTDDPGKYPHDAGFPPGVEIRHRDELDRVQRELREEQGVTVLVHDQTCAAEKRRRRKRGAFLPQVTADLRVDYVRAARKGRTVIGRGECYKATRSIGFVRGIAYDETPDDPVAHVAGTFILIDGARG